MATSSNALNFACPHCQTQLSVPVTMAGITGPCPNCSQQITAPPVPEVSQAPVQQAAPQLAGQPASPGTQPAQARIPHVPTPIQGHAGIAQQPQLQDLPHQQVQQPHVQLQQTHEQPPQQPTQVPQQPTQTPQQPAQEQQPHRTPDNFPSLSAPPAPDRPVILPPSQAARVADPSPGSEVPKDEPRSRRRERSRPSARAQRSGPSKKLVGVLVGAVALLVGGALATPKLIDMLGSTPAPQPTNVDADTRSPVTSPNPNAYKPIPEEDQHLLNNTKPTLTERPPVPPLEDEPPVEIEGILDPPRDFLANYLTTSDWNDLIPQSVGGATLQGEMAAYYKEHPYTPEKVLEMTFQHKQKLPDSEYQFYLFKVVTESNPRSFPMTVEETSDGYRTDWVTYTQFKDMHLQKFLDLPDIDKSTGKGETHVFNVILRRAHDFTDEVPDSDNKWCYRIDAPVDAANAEELGGYSFIPKHSKYGQELDLSLKWLLSYFPIVELRWEIDQDYPDRPYVRLMKIRQFNWRGHDATADTLETVSANPS